jgi:RND family efflux transporter MFP subunit
MTEHYENGSTSEFDSNREDIQNSQPTTGMADRDEVSRAGTEADSSPESARGANPSKLTAVKGFFAVLRTLFHTSSQVFKPLTDRINAIEKLPVKVTPERLLGGILIAILGTVGYLAISNRSIDDIDLSSLATDVDTIEISKKLLEHRINTPGTITFKDKASISSKILGRIATIKKDQGETVKKGEILAELETFELKIKLEQANSAMKSAKANLEMAKARYNESRKNTSKEIKSLDRVQAEIIDSKSSYLIAKKNFENKKELYDMGGISKQEFQKVYAEYLNAASNYYKSRKQFQVASVGFRDKDLPETKGGSGSKEEAMIEANTKIEKSGIAVAEAQYQSALSDYRAAQQYMDEARIRSPIDGVVASRNIDIGEEVKQGEPIFTVVRTDILLITTSISESDIKYIKKDQSVEISVDALNDRKIEGTVFQIAPVLDVKSRSAEVRILVRNEENSLNPGMFARCSIFVRKKEDGISVPEDAILEKKEEESITEATLFTIRDSIALKKEVILGERYGAEYEVLKGLEPGERIASSNIRLLKDGMSVKVKNPEQAVKSDGERHDEIVK